MKPKLLIFAGLASVAAVALALQSGKSVYVNGKYAGTSIEKNGVTYVPLKDIASALNLSVSKTSRGIELSAPGGGANQVEGINGKVGQVLFNGFVRLEVTSVFRGSKYTNKFSGDNQEVTPYPENMDLLVVTMRIRNGTKAKETVFLPGGGVSGLADDKGRSHAYRTGLSIDCPTRGAELLPGAAVEFALTFDIPKDAKGLSLVYEPYWTGKAGKAPFRVDLGQ